MASLLKVDALTGVTTAGSISVTGEGNSTTTNLQQGLAKAWCQHAGSTPLDSFNIASLTDNATGNMSCTYTNAMNNALYAATMSGATTGFFIAAYNDGQVTTAKFNNTCWNYNGASLADPDHAMTIIAGDLA